jgi:hypothetical protein
MKLTDFKALFYSSFKGNPHAHEIYQLLLEIIRNKGDDEHVSVTKLSNFIDFFNFLPILVKREKNNSKELFYIMTSNKVGAAGAKEMQNGEGGANKGSSAGEDKNHFKKTMQLLWSKIYERFKTINEAFRFFDADFDQGLSYNEFCQGVDYLRVKMSQKDLKQIYQYLDKDGDGHIGYNEFCELCEERW